MKPLARLLNPKSVAVFGGAWASNVIQQLHKSGYTGTIWPIHPSTNEVLGEPCFPDINSLPASPDCAFIGVNREQTVLVVRELSKLGAGGAVCFASGFKETQDDDSTTGSDLQSALIKAAGDMLILGPNCYGYLNYLDNVTVWPDQHGGQKVQRGVAIIAQSSNIAINMTMQRRGLPLAYMITVGNQAQTSVSDLARELIADTRVSVIGLYLESFGNIRCFEALASQARLANKIIVVLKIGKSRKAKAASMTHTASLAGSAAASSALLRRLAMVEVNSISVFLETLKLLDGVGPLKDPNISSVSCSGGEASLVADLAINTAIQLPDFSHQQRVQLAKILGSKVTLANPLDYHTYIWGDVATMTACFAAVVAGRFALNVFVLDIPREDICDPAGHECAIQAIIAAKKQSAAKVTVLSNLAENLNQEVTQRLQLAGVVPLHGMQTGLKAIDAAIRAGEMRGKENILPVFLANNAQNQTDNDTCSLTEHEAKMHLSQFGLLCPRSSFINNKGEIVAAAQSHRFPVALKGMGIEHKSDAGAVILNIETPQSLLLAIESLPDCSDGYLIEDMVADNVAELIIGVTRDDVGLLLLTLGAGGILTELLSDTVSLLLPASRDEIFEAVQSLKIYQILQGYRGKPTANINAVVDAVAAVSRYVEANLDCIEELEINPLIVGQNQVSAVDALIRLRH